MLKKIYNQILLREDSSNNHETMLTDFTNAEPKTIFDGGYSSFALTPYSAGDNGVTFDQQHFEENNNRDYIDNDYVKFLTEKKQLLIDDLHDLYEIYKYNKSHIQEILETVKDKKSYYSNLLKLQEFLDKKMGLKEDLLYWSAKPLDKNGDISELGIQDNNIDGITEGVIQEAIADLPRNISDEIAQRAAVKMNWGRPIILDKGGYAYEIGNRILKITTDESEAVDSQKMIGKTSNYIADVYNVFLVNYDKHKYYVILMEKLRINRDKFLKIYKELDKVFRQLFSLGYYDIIELYDEDPNNYNKFVKPKFDKVLKKFTELGKFWNSLLLIANEVKRLGINSLDFASVTNLGYKPSGNLAFFDLGLSGEKFNNAQPVELNMEAAGAGYYMTDHGDADANRPTYAQGLQLERQMYWIPGSQMVSVKKKCRLGGLGNGKSAQCNWGDMDSLDLGSPMSKKTENEDYNESIKDKTELTDNLPEEANSKKKKDKKINEIIAEDIDHSGDLYFFYDGTFNQRPGNDAQAPTGDIVSKDLNEIINKVIEEDIINYKDPNFNENLTTYGSFEDKLNDKGMEENKHPDINDEEKGCLMLYLDMPDDKWKRILLNIKNEDVYNEEGYGRTGYGDQHITILYGFNPEVTSNQVFDLLKKNIKLKPIKVKITGIGCFENPEFDVVKFNVESEELQKIHEIINKLPNKQDFSDYKPHCTISYCRKGTGKKYVKDFNKSHYIIGNKLVFSSADDKKDELILNENSEKVTISKDLDEDVEYINDRLIRLNDGQINYIKQVWESLSDFDRKSGKYGKLYDKAINYKVLDIIDWQELKHYLKFGHSKVYYA